MKTRETIQIEESKVIKPSGLLMVIVIMLLSFAVGSIPLIFGLTTAKTNDLCLFCDGSSRNEDSALKGGI